MGMFFKKGMSVREVKVVGNREWSLYNLNDDFGYSELSLNSEYLDSQLI